MAFVITATVPFPRIPKCVRKKRTARRRYRVPNAVCSWVSLTGEVRCTSRVPPQPDRTYDLKIGQPTVSYFLKQAAGIAKGAGKTGEACRCRRVPSYYPICCLLSCPRHTELYLAIRRLMVYSCLSMTAESEVSIFTCCCAKNFPSAAALMFPLHHDQRAHFCVFCFVCFFGGFTFSNPKSFFVRRP